MAQVLTDFSLPELGEARRGKVRDIYDLGETLLLIASDRISCFDCILSQPIPHKGQVLTGISAYWFTETQDIVPNHLIDRPHGNVMRVHKCTPLPVEIVVRGYMSGSMWRDYRKGRREKCGVALADGLSEGMPLPHPIVTPTTKAETGHDEDISSRELIKHGILSEALWDQLETIALKLYVRGSDVLSRKGLILVDTKYEFGFASDGTLMLIDEVHTPDSSRFWFTADQAVGEFRHPDKEFVRAKLLEHGFQGDGAAPLLSEHTIEETSRRYRSIYEAVLGTPFQATEPLLDALKRHGLVRGCFAQLLLVYPDDMDLATELTARLSECGISSDTRLVADADLDPCLVRILQEQQLSIEPVVYITVGRPSANLAELLESHADWPILRCDRSSTEGSYRDPLSCAEAAEHILNQEKEPHV